MLPALPYKTKQFLLVLVKLGVVVAAFYFIHFKLIHHNHLTWEEYERISKGFSTLALISLSILSLLNWFFEILKWQTLAHHVSKISLKEATAQSLAALTASLPTPNRFGEYGAKAMYYPHQAREKIVVLNLLGNIAQMTITCIFGIIGLLFVLGNFQLHLNYIYLLFGFVGFVTLIFLLPIMLRHQKLHDIRKMLQRWFDHIATFSPRAHLKVLGFALTRYLIFSFQFYYLLLLFGVQLNVFAAFVTIFSMYFLSSIIPSIFIFDIVVKGGVALFLFAFIGVPDAVILSVVTLMWISNFVLPSIAGAYYVLTFRMPKIVS